MTRETMTRSFGQGGCDLVDYDYAYEQGVMTTGLWPGGL